VLLFYYWGGKRYFGNVIGNLSGYRIKIYEGEIS